MSTVSLKFDENQQIAIVTLERAEAANAMSLQLLEDLNHSLHEIESTPNVRCVVLTASGEKAFCAGADLKERAGMNEREVVQTVKKIGQTVRRVEQLPIPVVAAINGVAFGGGLELALACDLRVSSDSAKMGLTEVSLGIIPGAGGTQRLTRLVGLGKAKELIYAAKRLTAEEALRIGLVEHIAPLDELQAKAMELAQSIAKNAPIALKQAKQAINQGSEVDLATGLKIEEMCYAITIPTKDRLEGLQAFKEKRKPEYKGE